MSRASESVVPSRKPPVSWKVGKVDFTSDWRIVSPSADPVASLASGELQDVLRRVTGKTLPVVREQYGHEPVILLSHDDGSGDGYRWSASASPERVELHGQNARGLLNAVYGFLEALGCRWVAPGEAGERLPRGGTQFDIPLGSVEEAPALPGRCLIVGHYAFMADVEDWIIWSARNRLNTIFLHVIESPLAMGAAPERQWQAHRETAVALARQRGMTIEHGGHGLPDLLPRKLFKQMPEAFRYHDGARVRDHNFCPSSEQALAEVRKNAEVHFRSHPEVDVFHLWPDDIPGGGWCACERCQPFSPSEQLLLATNAVAEVLEDVNPAAEISFIAYMDTEAVPTKVQPRPNVHMLWAPRSRCYAHPTDDDGCRVNSPHYHVVYREQEAHFADVRPARVFEYYLDAVLFKSVLPPLGDVMQQDIRFYRDAGAHTVQALMTGDRPWLTPQLNAWLFARLTWNPEQDLDDLVADFCRATFGTDSPELVAYYGALEKAYALALDIVPEQIMRDADFGIKNAIDRPIADMGDPAYAPPDVLQAKCEMNAAIDDLAQEAGENLEAARPVANTVAWEAERAAFDLHSAWLRFDLARVQLYDAVATEPVARDALQRFDEAQSALGEVLAWGDTHIEDERYRKNFRAIHRVFWGMNLRRIRSQHFTGGLSWFFARLGSLLQLAWTFLGMRGMYKE